MKSRLSFYKSIIVSFFACLFLASTAMAQNDDARAKYLLESMLRQTEADANWFAQSFTSQVPVSQINDIVGRIKGQLGNLERVDGSGNDWRLVFAKFTVPTQIAIDDDGRITGLFFRPPTPRSDLDPGDAASDLLQAVSGQASLYVRKGERSVRSENSTAPMAVGSAFKMLVLAEYERRIAAGTLQRSDVVTLNPLNKSLPSGSLQNWPDGTPITLATAAGLMISQSDNTATDTLIDAVGRARLEAISKRNTPFLKTTEVFKLKAADQETNRKAYLESNTSGRRSLLDTVSKRPMPTISELDPEPSIGIGWFFTTEELCRMAVDVIDAPAMRLSSGPISPEGWQTVAYKGGSDAGVLNLTAVGRYSDGSTACASLTVNTSQPIQNQNELALKFGALFASLAE